MKNLVLVLAVAFTTSVNAQWKFEKVNNGLDDPYKICWNKNQYGELLKIEKTDVGLIVYLQHYKAFEQMQIRTDLSFFVNGAWKKYDFVCDGVGEETVIIIGNLLDGDNLDVKTDFLNATKLKFRLNYEDYESEIYEFNMQGSTAAIKFMIN
jgi:hypothetical protein